VLVGSKTRAITLQNGVDSVERLAPILGNDATIGGATYIVAKIARPGVILHTGANATALCGRLDGRPDALLAGYVEQIKAANIDIQLTDHMLLDLWKKFVLLSGTSGMTATTRQPLGVIRGDDDMRAFLYKLMQDTMAVGRAAGVQFPSDFQAGRKYGVPTPAQEAVRALTSYDRDSKNKPALSIKPLQLELFLRIAASHFQNVGHPNGGWSGDENAWDAADYIRSLLSALSADKSSEATEALERLALDPAMVTYLDSIKHALANQRARYREMIYKQPNWAESIASLSGGAPANVADLQALVVEDLREISKRIGTQNIDVYKDFWNEDSHGRPVEPKIEESARNVLLALLKTRLDPLGIIVEPEGHMVADKRADITAALPGRKLILELKRDIHAELWSAPATQLDCFYTRDPEAGGYGVFGVFWYGKHRQGTLPKHPKGNSAAKDALELETMLNDIIVGEQRSKLRAVVIDVSVPDGQRVGTAKRRRKKAKNLKSKGSMPKRTKRTPAKPSKSKPLKGKRHKTSPAPRKAEARGKARRKG
jgi:Ketopantoate reductase PanE/ApbA C terminal/Ketopantoate reductase PanE/ApbA